MANSNPSKSDIEAVFNRLRTIPTNKVRFFFDLIFKRNKNIYLG